MRLYILRHNSRSCYSCRLPPQRLWRSLFFFLSLKSFHEILDSGSVDGDCGWGDGLFQLPVIVVDGFSLPFGSFSSFRDSRTALRENDTSDDDRVSNMMTINDADGGLQPEQQQKQEYRRRPIGRVTSLDRSKIDTSIDMTFYQNPNFVTHIDDGYIKSLEDVYRRFLIPPDNRANGNEFENGLIVLDLMSSHVSHYPRDVLQRIQRVDVHGMNREELEQNEARRSTNGDIYVRDLNANPSLVGLGMLDQSMSHEQTTETSTSTRHSNHSQCQYYDAVTCCVGIQYLEEPEAVLAEVGRILRPRTGIVIISFSNRFFYQKAIQGWINRGMKERARLVQDFLRAAGGFDDIHIVGDGVSIWNQLGSLGGLLGDPFVAVVARRNDDA